jgi:uncharacterized membrane protein YfcA
MEWVPLAGALVGFIVGLTGVGGGALMAPILLVGFGVDLITVVATDLIFATITKLTASAIHNKNSLVDWQVAKRMWAGSIPASLFVITLVYLGYTVENDEVVTQLLGILILISAISLLFGPKLQLLQRSRRITQPEQFKRYQGITTNLAGAVLGGLVTLTSVGAGALGAVMLRTLYPLRMTPQRLVATDTVHAIPVSLIAGASYLALGFVDLTLLGLLLVGSIPSALIASKLMNRLPNGHIKTILGGALLAAGIKLITA